jgi:hypothetical protein
VACFYYIRLIKIFFFVKDSKNSFWLSHNVKQNTEILIGLLTFLNVCFFLRPDFISHFSTVVCFSIV